jgi:hypothetical protein
LRESDHFVTLSFDLGINSKTNQRSAQELQAIKMVMIKTKKKKNSGNANPRDEES